MKARIAMLGNWVRRRVTPACAQWFDGALREVAHEGGEPALARALGWAPRKLGKADLGLSDSEAEQAAALRPGLDAALWSVDQAARIAFILAGLGGEPEAFAGRLDSLADTAELNEAIALYRGFPLYPAAAAIEARARAAVRSAMRPLFEAIAHRNPYPAEQFDEAAWNQMVVKTFFLDSPLWPVQGIERRANPALAAILLDLAHERWAAGRAVSAELWRCVAPYPGPAACAAMERVLAGGSEPERLGVALALARAEGSDAALLRAACARQGLDQRAARAGWAALAAASG
ncbi:EboA domain-containing protein [Massilia aquatica]|uniref:ERAP1-like C-terminal domain-containing protein n=1 Tax=Massilia aquatica TaxID=2609000 RepID=A0ABX0MC63_9BURK|nr:EboA domain-containing protein [Massilia aquatica]NHZ41626.1 hypothetical protein [Massilia aquatica]